MTYHGTEKTIHVGDHVLYAGDPGLIVFVVEDDSYSDRYSRDAWSYLGSGLGVELADEAQTLYHLDAPDEDLEPVSLDSASNCAN